MDDWTEGYVTELPYSVNHFPEMAPAHLRLALLHAGLAAPRIDEDFSYLELGFGQGLGLNMLAAAHPQGRFFGNDFMPAHVAAAQALAAEACLSNLQLVQDSFAQLHDRDLPPMDFIVLHGVYTWVNAENRAHIVALIARLLKPGGVVYVSYEKTGKRRLGHPVCRIFPTNSGVVFRLTRTRARLMIGAMTYARKILIPPGSPGTFHCVSRCVRRAFLCGEDRLSGRSFEHRRQWVEDRIHELAGIFGVAVWGYAVMSNHVHVVVQTLPEAVAAWSADEVAARWLRLFPRQDQNAEMRAEVLAGNKERIKVLRQRLSDLLKHSQERDLFQLG